MNQKIIISLCICLISICSASVYTSEKSSNNESKQYKQHSDNEDLYETFIKKNKGQAATDARLSLIPVHNFSLIEKQRYLLGLKSQYYYHMANLAYEYGNVQYLNNMDYMPAINSSIVFLLLSKICKRVSNNMLQGRQYTDDFRKDFLNYVINQEEATVSQFNQLNAHLPQIQYSKITYNTAYDEAYFHLLREAYGVSIGHAYKYAFFPESNMLMQLSDLFKQELDAYDMYRAAQHEKLLQATEEQEVSIAHTLNQIATDLESFN